MEEKLLSILDLNIDTILKVAWIDFIKIEKLIYIVGEVKKTIFVKTSLTQLDISFTNGDQYVILYLKQNKIDTGHNRI